MVTQTVSAPYMRITPILIFWSILMYSLNMYASRRYPVCKAMSLRRIATSIIRRVWLGLRRIFDCFMWRVCEDFVAIRHSFARSSERIDVKLVGRMRRSNPHELGILHFISNFINRALTRKQSILATVTRCHLAALTPLPWRPFFAPHTSDNESFPDFTYPH